MKKPHVRIFPLQASSRRARGVRRKKTLSASLSALGRAVVVRLTTTDHDDRTSPKANGIYNRVVSTRRSRTRRRTSPRRRRRRHPSRLPSRRRRRPRRAPPATGRSRRRRAATTVPVTPTPEQGPDGPVRQRAPRAERHALRDHAPESPEHAPPTGPRQRVGALRLAHRRRGVPVPDARPEKPRLLRAQRGGLVGPHVPPIRLAGGLVPHLLPHVVRGGGAAPRRPRTRSRADLA